MRSRLLAYLLPLATLAACDCNGETATTGATGSGGAPSSTTTTSAAAGGGGSTGSFTSTGTGMTGPSFPDTPIIEGTAPANSGDLFGPAGSGDPTGGPCIVEPELGALLPNNWLRPRFRWVPGAGQNLFELRLHAASEPNDLVVYTTDVTYTMEKLLWLAVSAGVVDEPITVTIRGANFDGTTLVGPPAIGSTGTITIAPVGAPGSIVYWTTSGGSSLKGFQVGDESVITALAPNQVAMPTNGGAVTCVGCHTSTPDGLYASFVAQGPWSNALGSIEGMSVGATPPFLGAGALQFLTSSTELGIHTYSKAHWSNGDHVMVTPSGTYADSELIWVDLEAASAAQGTAWGFLARNGDTLGAGSPAWSHDGASIVYVSTDVEFTGRLDNGFADLYSVPYANRQGGTATPIPGASTPEYAEYYPALSPDDALIAFNRIPNGQNMYDAPSAEVFVLPREGGTPVRIAANDPPACSGKTSPGVTNSWPKWAPEAQTSGGRTYYWLVFSSRRGQAQNPQLYLTAVVTHGNTIETYPALYLWNQPEDESNHTPAWDVFEIPPVPPPQ
ncbi:MAG TPA: hypothetical protein VL400_22835 [Polyangiaceae bacterium]|nr:hypothetical protein [Polyangiaceae bacterium]